MLGWTLAKKYLALFHLQLLFRCTVLASGRLWIVQKEERKNRGSFPFCPWTPAQSHAASWGQEAALQISPQPASHLVAASCQVRKEKVKPKDSFGQSTAGVFWKRWLVFILCTALLAHIARGAPMQWEFHSGGGSTLKQIWLNTLASARWDSFNPYFHLFLAPSLSFLSLSNCPCTVLSIFSGSLSHSAHITFT